MIIKKLVVENFLPFKDVQEIDLAPEPGRPVVIVFADNMRGKTSILNAIRWSLYGVAYKHSAKRIPAHLILNGEARANGIYNYGVTLEFIVGNDSYRLSRLAAPRRLVDRPERDADYEQHVSMVKNGTPLPQDQIIHEVNQVAPEQISRFFLFDGELLDQYEALLVEGSEQGRLIRDAIERVLGVPALVRARDDLRLLERSAIRDHDRDTRQVEGVEEQETMLATLLDEADQLDENTLVYRRQLDEHQKEIDELEAALEGAERALGDQARLEEILRSIDNEDATVEKTKAELRAARARMWEDILADAVRPVAEGLDQEAAKLLSAAQEQESIGREIAKLERHLGEGVCATCKQPLPSGARREIESELKTLFDRLSGLSVNPHRHQQVVARVHRIGQIRHNGSLNTAASMERVLTEATLRQVELEGERDQLRSDLEGQDTESMKVKRARLKAVESHARKLRDALRDAEDASAKKQRQAMVLRKAIEGSSTSARQAKSQRRRTIVTTLRTIVDETIEALRSRLKNEVEVHATAAFKRMTTQPLYDRLQINDSYGLAIIDCDGREVPLRSAGAEQVVALSLINGLHKTGMGSGGVIMDTPFGRLDPTHRKNIVGHLATSSPQVVMLVHEGEMPREFVIENLSDSVARSYQLESEGVLATRIERVMLGVDI